MSGFKAALALTMCCVLVTQVGVSSAGETSPGDCVSDDPHWQCGHLLRAMRELESRDGGPRGPGDPQPETLFTDVLHTKIDIKVEPDPLERTVIGTVTMTARSLIDGLTEFVAYLNPTGGQMVVTQVGVNGTGFTYVDGKVTVTLDGVYNTDDEFTVSIDYGGWPTDGIYWGSHDPGTGPVPIVATLSEPFSARGWWVGKDVLDDKCTFDIWVTVPGGYVVASNGILQGVDTIGNAKRYRWEEINPMIPYLASIAVADYDIYLTTYDHLGDQMPMEFYLLPENMAAWQGHCDTYVTMTEIFSDIYGQYPFIDEKGGMANTPTLGNTYMEHQTIPSMPRFDILWVNAHELAHQWWGDMITCETWGDIWLNEGITSFSEAIWQEFKPGGSVAAYHSRMASRRPSTPDSQVYVTDVNNVGAIFSTNSVYNKGAWVTHMLRHVLGDETFFDALLDYRAAFEGDSATTAEFIASVSATAGFDLTFFTDQWVMNPGSPDYDWAWQHGDAGGQDYLVFEIAQTQDDRGYDLMTMPVDVAVTTDVSTTTYVVWCIDDVSTFAIPIDGTPLQVELDPDDWVLTHSVTESTPSGSPPTCQGDMNDDGDVNGLDIQPFIAALLDPGAGPVTWKRSDMDFDGRCAMDDLPLFADALLGVSGCGDITP